MAQSIRAERSSSRRVARHRSRRGSRGVSMLEQLMLVGLCAFVGILAFYHYGKILSSNLNKQADLIEGKDLTGVPDPLNWIAGQILSGNSAALDPILDDLSDLEDLGISVPGLSGPGSGTSSSGSSPSGTGSGTSGPGSSPSSTGSSPSSTSSGMGGPGSSPSPTGSSPSSTGSGMSGPGSSSPSGPATSTLPADDGDGDTAGSDYDK